MSDLAEIWKRLPPDWHPVTDDAAKLLKELKREMFIGHALSRFKRGMRVFARADYSDDIAVMLADGRIAEVHLTWKRELAPEWPHTSPPMPLEEWLASREEDRKWRQAAIDEAT